MKPIINWVLMANSSYAEIFEVKAMHVTFLQRMTFEERREKMHDIVSDKQGHNYSRMGVHGGGGHMLGSEDGLRRHEESIFAHEIVEFLVKAKAEHLFNILTFIAAPHFLGELRNVMKLKSHHLSIDKEIHKDFPQRLSEHEKIAHIKELLDI
ncbi:MAG: host attachment protein [Chlamydiae bacterium]|nr:host attachment protein [Chlamydiota bacterium]